MKGGASFVRDLLDAGLLNGNTLAQDVVKADQIKETRPATA